MGHPSLLIKDEKIIDSHLELNVEGRDIEMIKLSVISGIGLSSQMIPITVNVEAGTSLNYIQSTNPKSVLKVITVADYTFICNTEVITALSDTVDTSPMASNVALFKI